MYLQLPKLFDIKLKVKVRPTVKLHFKLGFPYWYLESFNVNFSVILHLSSKIYQMILFKGWPFNRSLINDDLMQLHW